MFHCEQNIHFFIEFHSMTFTPNILTNKHGPAKQHKNDGSIEFIITNKTINPHRNRHRFLNFSINLTKFT